MNHTQLLQKGLHPELSRRMASIALPVVKELIRKLSKYGLAVTIPHMHDDYGNLVPLPHDRVVHEVDLHVSFPHKDSDVINGSVPIMWRWQENAVGVTALCCGDPFPSGHCCSGPVQPKK